MKSIRIRALTPSDGGKLRALVRTRDGIDAGRAEARALAMEWIAFRNPFAEGEATYFVADDGGDIVAYLGRMPTYFVVGGRLVRGYFAHDLFAHPDLRRRGLGYPLTVALYKEIEAQSRGAYCMLGMTPVNLRIQKRLGYRELPVGRSVKFLHARALSTFVPAPLLVSPVRVALSAMLRTADAVLCRAAAAAGTIQEIQRFDSSFDGFMDRIMGTIGICPYKTSAYLNWKHVDGPYARRIVLESRAAGEVRGFVVLLVVPDGNAKKGYILDLMADPNDRCTVRGLCSAALRRFRREGANAVDCQLTDGRLVPFLRRMLFLGARSLPTMTVARIELLSDRIDVLTRTENWHITHSDSDGFMFGS